jgi:hypothetical protein
VHDGLASSDENLSGADSHRSRTEGAGSGASKAAFASVTTAAAAAAHDDDDDEWADFGHGEAQPVIKRVNAGVDMQLLAPQQRRAGSHHHQVDIIDYGNYGLYIYVQLLHGLLINRSWRS